VLTSLCVLMFERFDADTRNHHVEKITATAGVIYYMYVILSHPS
jgi:hypothetical protein